MARPKLTCSGLTTAGLPSTSVKPLFISGISASALTTAKPIRWVNDTLPPRPRCSALLMTVRLSMSSLAGTARTLVAVGTARLASMLVTTRAAGPLSGVRRRRRPASRRARPQPGSAAAGLASAACGCGGLLLGGLAACSAASASRRRRRRAVTGAGPSALAWAPVGGRRAPVPGSGCGHRRSAPLPASPVVEPRWPGRRRAAGSPRRSPTTPCRPSSCPARYCW